MCESWKDISLYVHFSLDVLVLFHTFEYACTLVYIIGCDSYMNFYLLPYGLSSYLVRLSYCAKSGNRLDIQDCSHRGHNQT